VDPLFIAYLTFTTILVATPGSTTAVIVRNALTGGRAAGIAAAVGAAVGNTSHAALAGLGLAVIFNRWPLAMVVLRVSGAAYLAWLGGRSLLNVILHPDGGLSAVAPARAVAPSGVIEHRSSVRQGLTVNLLNPAIATFYLVVLPSFIPAESSRWHFAALASIHIGLAFLFHGAWAIALDRVRKFFHPPVTRRILEGATGVALIWLALRVLGPLRL
jgi:threonine/homoserine/homoserine lactone efflux protein